MPVEPNVFWLIGTILVAAITFLGGLFTKRSQASSDHDSTTQESHVDINMLLDVAIKGLNAEVEALKLRIAALEARESELQDEIDDRDTIIADMQERIERLELWVRAQGVDPDHVVAGIVPPHPLN